MRLTTFKLLLVLITPVGLFAQREAVVCTGQNDIVSMWELDPHEGVPAHLDDIRRQIYDTLYELDPAGNVTEGLVEHCKVDSYSEDVESNAEMSINCRLRSGIFFHDGNELNPHDVVFSIRRIKGSRTLSSEFEMVKDVFISGQKDVKFLLRYNVGGIDMPNKWLFERFKRVMARNSYIGRKKYFEDGGSWAIEYPVGTGPFYFKDWKIWDKKESRSQIIVYKNKSYWKKGYPKIDQLYFRFMPSSMWAQALSDGSLELAYRMPYSSYAALKKKDVASGAYKKSKRLIYSYEYLLFSPYSKYLAYTDVRQAFLKGINRERLARLNFNGNVMINSGRSLYASCPFPERFQARPYKPFEAKLEVAEFLKAIGAKKTKKIPLNILVPDLSEQLLAVQELRNQLYPAGFLLKIKKLPYSKYLAVVNSGNLKGYDVVLYSMEENPVFTTPHKLSLLANGGIQLYQRYMFYAMARPDKGGFKEFVPAAEGPIELKDAE